MGYVPHWPPHNGSCIAWTLAEVVAFLSFPAHVTPLGSFHQRRCRFTCVSRCMMVSGDGLLSHALSFLSPLLAVVGTRRRFVVIQKTLRDIRSLKSVHVKRYTH